VVGGRGRRVLSGLAALALAALAPAAEAGGERLRFVDLDGAPVSLGPPAPGEALVVHYWATWCPNCLPELAVLERAAQACAASGVRVVAVDVGEPAARVREALAEHGLVLPVLLDPKGRTWRADGGRELPANRIWTARERTLAFGPSDEATWRARLAALGCSGAVPAP